MIGGEFNAWQNELVELGQIPQEDDESVSPSEAESWFNRYVELVHLVDGTEGPAAVAALVSSMQAENDYGAYQSTHGALALFPISDLVRGVAMAIQALVLIPEDHGGEVLSAVAAADEASVREFNSVVAGLEPDQRRSLGELIARQESDGWLSDEGLPGRLQV